MIKFSKFTWATIAVFVLAFLCVMFNTVWSVLVYPALALIIVGLIMLTIKFAMQANKKFKHDEMVQQELIMELSVTDEGEQYVLNDKSQKKHKKALRREKLNGLMPAIFCGLMAGIMLFLLIKMIFNF